MSAGGPDYGRAGLVGIGTPQANPTVEAEMRLLLAEPIGTAVTRLTSAAAAPVDRLRDYLRHLSETLATFDTLRLAAFGFACTASSYLVEPGEEQAVVAACQARFGYPVLTAAAAIATVLHRLGARRIALISPYPEPLRQAAVRYWQAQGFELGPVLAAGDLASPADTRGIYSLGSGDAAAVIARADLTDVDAILLSGTGMPSLPVIARWTGPVPLLSSNLCLAAVLAERVGQGDLIDPASPACQAWQARCRALAT